MCTVTIVTPGDTRLRWRMACNRDESRTRQPARPPQTQPFGPRTAILPRDGESGGTWAAVNDAAVVMTLLNVNPPEATAAERSRARDSGSVKSRGLIIPSLLHCRTTRQAPDLANSIEPRSYLPFRLVIVDDLEMAEVQSDGQELSWQRREMGRKPGAMLFTSSGLGDHLVEPPRRRLFEQFFVKEHVHNWCARQDGFHRHRWPDMPHLSVCMSRDDARTVSFTVIERHARSAKMVCRPDAPDQPAKPVTAEMPVPNFHKLETLE